MIYEQVRYDISKETVETLIRKHIAEKFPLCQQNTIRVSPVDKTYDTGIGEYSEFVGYECTFDEKRG